MFHPTRILVATDFSPHARAAADAAATLGRCFGGHLTLLHVVPLSSYVEYSAGMEGLTYNAAQFQEAVRSGVQREAAAEVARLREDGVNVELVTRDGPPAHEICAYAQDRGFDLIVVGSHGRTGLKRFLLGSVAESVVRHAHAPVLTIRGQ